MRRTLATASIVCILLPAVAHAGANCAHSSSWQCQHAGAHSGSPAIGTGGSASIATEVRPTDAPAALGVLTPDVHNVVLQPSSIGATPSLAGGNPSGPQAAQPQAPIPIPTAVPPTAIPPTTTAPQQTPMLVPPLPQAQAPVQVPTTVPPTAQHAPDSGMRIPSHPVSGNGQELGFSMSSGQSGEPQLTPAHSHALIVHAPDTPAPVTSGRYSGATAYSLEFIEPGLQNRRVKVYRSHDAAETVYGDTIPLDKGGFQLIVIGTRNPDYIH